MIRIHVRLGFLVLLLGGIQPHAATADASPFYISLMSAFEQAENADPRIQSSVARVSSAEHSEGIAWSSYLPTIEGDAIETSGFPASSGILGIYGLVGSPYRSGVAVGIQAKQNIWDFGRTAYAISSAKKDTEARKSEVVLTKISTDQEILENYLDCSLNRSQFTTLVKSINEAQVITDEVARFVRTGQRSQADLYLSQAQLEESRTSQAEFQEKLNLSSRRLLYLMGKEDQGETCPPLPESVDLGFFAFEKKSDGEPGINPYVLSARGNADSAIEREKAAYAEHYPRIVAMAGVAAMESYRLVSPANYAVAIGAVIPVFDGWKTTETVAKAAAYREEKENDLEVARRKVDTANLKYDELIQSAAVRLEHLEKELIPSNEAFDLAKKRYLRLQGTLTDVRDTLRNLNRVLLSFNEAKHLYLKARGLKWLMNHGSPVEKGGGK